MGRLTTHILDTAHGKPAEKLALSLYKISGKNRDLRCEAVTNADGRCDGPLLEGEEFQPGEYELEFQAGDYFRRLGVALPDPPFFDVVVLRFGLATDEHYHVPLLVSPYSYSTYRGS